MRSKEKSITAVIRKNGEAQTTIQNCDGMDIGFMVTAISKAAGEIIGEVVSRTATKRFLFSSMIEGLKLADMPVSPEDLQELADALETDVEGTA
ncbi:hypothetical protein MKA48_05230 [[Clostridium] innocuum]|nr:hypothetical protein [[Clostridium] innocuum]